MDFAQLDWSILDRLREGFLTGQAAKGPYWRQRADLDQYDLTYGERIGWKWDALLHELRRRNWAPPPGSLLDWGCGSGVAVRRVASAWPGLFPEIQCWDHSALAREYAAERVRRVQPSAQAMPWDQRRPFQTLVLSHVLTELDAKQLETIEGVIRQADALLWIEPGTHAVGRTLAAMRDRLRDEFDIVAPCTHRENCPLFAADRERDWCHFFALPPPGIYADSSWVRFGQRAGIDLRSLPYSCLVLNRLNAPTSPAAFEPDVGRMLGRPSLNKAYAEWLHCDKAGLHDLKVPKRTAPALYKALDKRPGLPLVQVARDAEGGITDAQEVFPRGE